MARRATRRPPERERARALEVVRRLGRAMPEARIALDFGDDLQLLASVILSAQSTDARVNLVTPALFARYPDAASWAAARPEELYPYIQTLGLFRAKAKALVGAMRAIAGEHGGRVPRTREALEALPGVGRKTAGVVLIHLGAGEAFPVDTHVGRVARRLGFTRERDPDRVEERLTALLPRESWAQGHQLFVWHGRRTCFARSPACERCVLDDLCPKVGVPRRRPAPA
ncbi:MAG TPA: endonuclease III [Anaeromyxobacteraceae bacterium]|nr:endonuclease III [Anaeromyxobacteraceae bacterium]